MSHAGNGPGLRQRPLSPHIDIYTFKINMIMSILHRITGAMLYLGTVLLACWLLAAAAGPEHFAYVNGWFGTWLGRLVLFGYTWALLHHMLGGIRHFIWDLGYGFDLETVDQLGWMTGIGAAALTVLVWLAVMIF